MDRIDCQLIELKFEGASADDMTFSGYGAVFGNVDGYGDVIQKGAFAKTIANAKATGAWPAMLSQHGSIGSLSGDDTPIGVWTDLREDDNGLFVEGKLAPTPRGQEMHTLMKMTPRPAINRLSIGYKAIKFRMRSKPDEPRRSLEELMLRDVSPVTFPGNDRAVITGVKSIEELTCLSEAEGYLRDSCGLSRKEAVAFMSRLKRLGQSDSDGGTSEVVALLKRNVAILQPT